MASEEMTVALSAADVEPPDGEDDETHEADHDVYAACRQFEGWGSELSGAANAVEVDQVPGVPPSGQ